MADYTIHTGMWGRNTEKQAAAHAIHNLDSQIKLLIDQNNEFQKKLQNINTMLEKIEMTQFNENINNKQNREELQNIKKELKEIKETHNDQIYETNFKLGNLSREWSSGANQLSRLIEFAQKTNQELANRVDLDPHWRYPE